MSSKQAGHLVADHPAVDVGTFVVAVVTAFRPDERLVEVVRALQPQVDRIIVVDDGSPSSVVLPPPMDEVEILVHNANQGIAAALNTGSTRARSLGADYVLTVDQDSVLADDYVAEALRAMRLLTEAGERPAAVGAWILEPGSTAPDRSVVLMECRAALQSGLLMPVAVIERIGPYRESLFIDCVEAEYVLRARARGMKTFVSRACLIDHRLGEDTEINLLGRTVRFPLHSASRRYYITRNRLWLMVRYGPQQPVWTALQMKDAARTFFLSVISREGGGLHALAAALGFLDFARGRKGKMPARFGRLLADLAGASR